MSLFSKLEKFYRDTLFSRHDPDGTIFYFSSEDFAGLIRESYSFKTGRGDTLQGYLYSYDSPLYDRLVVFDHGMGAGHRAYMREIEMLARHGYTVFAYDHTGCSESEGEGIRGFAGSLADLDGALTAIKGDPRFADKKISVVGHSWGGFSTLNIAAYHPDVAHIVALSGFTSVKRMQAQLIPAPLFPLRRRLFEIEREANPSYVNADAEESLSDTKANVLIIHSKDDKTVKYTHFKRLYKKLSGKKNIRFMLLNGKNHNPNFSGSALKLMTEFFSALAEKKKCGELDTEEKREAFISSYDWWAMTEQDESVWSEIFYTLSL